ncbi:hypothetical protein EI546_05615 [Aequorivita sp. H23M31]|uniref:Alginate export domain-containing protein n=1 Tax=Aequorivita ciconiae TaxID=2494375 RepID=A0A410G1S9_9FLAO|nr:alginate export family protein [Aequorivita sp. H23M31]QAA81237.1 hypothetical protein EI546_05615 [Aequorivita sp. H23M31]
MKNLKYLFFLLLLLVLEPMFAQFTVDAQIRPRFEYRHGYKSPFPDNADPATFVSQRTRLNFGYQSELLHFYLSAQDVRVWGEVSGSTPINNDGITVHEAWGEILFSPQLFLKIGRQEIAYDDERMMGSSDWGQQARSHDVALLKLRPSLSFKVHLGVAYNQDKEALTGNLLTDNNYKSFQYLWFHKDWEKWNTSFLFLNNGLQYIDELDPSQNSTRYSQTAGFHIGSQLSKINLSSNLYYQFGKDLANNNINAYLFSVQGNYAASEKIKLGLGGEILSGNDYGTPKDGKNHSFNPIYGTNHKFNGLMDYFYAGNHTDNVGLIDIFGSANYSFNSKSGIILNFHKFFAASEIDSDISKDLGFEIDLVTSYSLNKFVGIKAGYSRFFTSEGTEIIKNNYDGNRNDWAWIMISINPVLFKWQAAESTNNL